MLNENDKIKSFMTRHIFIPSIVNILDEYIGKFRELSITRLNKLQHYIDQEISKSVSKRNARTIQTKQTNLDKKKQDIDLAKLITWANQVSPKSLQLASRMAVELSTIYCMIFNKEQPQKYIKAKTRVNHHMCDWCKNGPDIPCKFDKNAQRPEFYSISVPTRAFKELAYKNEYEILIRGREIIIKLRKLHQDRQQR